MGKGLRAVAPAAAAALSVCLGLAACEKTTEGSVAMTTEPGGPITTTTTTTPKTTTPQTTTPQTRTTTTPTTSTTTTTTTSTTTSAVPAPAGATTMKCSEFTQLAKPQRQAVVKQILQNNNSMFGPAGADFAEMMATTMCQFTTEETVYEVLTGSPPP
jgi:hypothetical protein